MRRTRRTGDRYRLAVAAALAMAVVTGPVWVSRTQAQTNSPAVLEETLKRRTATLEALFAELKAAPDQSAADAVVAKIWDQWMLSGGDDIDILMSRAVANMAGRHFGLAMLLLEEIIGLVPEYAEAWNKRATLHYHMGRYQEALEDIERTLQLEPRHFGALAGRAAILADTKRWKEALEAYRAALVINPFLQRRATIIQMLEKNAGERGL
jgi:tetratricopeptide (TPR) repeat protein